MRQSQKKSVRHPSSRDAPSSISAAAGQKLTLRFGEMLDKSGELTLKNIQCTSKKITTPLQKVEYTCKDGINEYKTSFATFGFKYMEIDTDIEVNAEDFTAIAVYSDMEEVGFFDSSNELLNKFVKAHILTEIDNSPAGRSDGHFAFKGLLFRYRHIV